MTKSITLICTFSLMLHLYATENRVVAVSSGVTEIVYSLNAQDQLVGNCVSSIFPEEANLLPKVGYQRMLPSEGILSLKPNLVILTSESGPKSVIDQLHQLNIEVVTVDAGRSLENIYKCISIIGSTLDKEAEARLLIKKLKNEKLQLDRQVKSLSEKPRVLFILGHGGMARVAGLDTAANSMIELSGGQNVISGFNGYKPVSPEELLELNPDYIVATTMGIDQHGGIDKFTQMSGLRDTSAVKKDRVLIFNAQYLLGFGPRTVTAAIDLNNRYDR